MLRDEILVLNDDGVWWLWWMFSVALSAGVARFLISGYFLFPCLYSLFLCCGF